ncbi:hypothetical protein [Tardiphaga sp.]|uniref:hypothetical protein n=1 Tax=Tardiphaga sp. TaxID=1926292 RepID=UPI002609C497|nr:hypothetical protein [Tardiphaga sp.]MDB5616221.1 hypothetical protein [Tardiphaga sp.]
MRVTSIALASLLAGCVTDDRQARLKPYIGQSLASLAAAVGSAPSASYPTARGRTFTLNGPALAVAVAPGVVAAGGCKMQVDTVQSGGGSTADDWRVVEINASGPC